MRRAGQLRSVATAQLVPGDPVLLEAGDHRPAGLRLSQVAQLRIDESALIGESATVDKSAEPLPPGEHAVAERSNMARKGH